LLVRYTTTKTLEPVLFLIIKYHNCIRLIGGNGEIKVFIV
jgi:hypothetical protein